MNLTRIETVHDLKCYLAIALKLEHSTIPPYLVALYSIKPGTNLPAQQILRVVAMEEMLHLTLAANLLNAIGGTPDLTGDDFVPEYPAHLADGEEDFWVNLERFSESAIKGFLQIERPNPPAAQAPVVVTRPAKRPASELLKVSHDNPDLQFHSIGEFYAEICRGFDRLHAELGERLFCGLPGRQITADYYYSAGGQIFPVRDIDSARRALRIIVEQGEGYGGGIYNHEGELAHYYRFQQLLLKRFYVKGNNPDQPTGEPLEVDFDAVYPVKMNPSFDDYPAGSELHQAASSFVDHYKELLRVLTQAYTGRPQRLQDAVAWMFALKDKAIAMMRNPIPGIEGLNAAPIFASSKKRELAPPAAGRKDGRLNRLWQNMPSMAFKTGLYDGITTVREARKHGDFGVGQFSALDGELIVADGSYYRVRSDGRVDLADDADELCFAQLCFYEPQHQWEAPADIDEQSFGFFLNRLLTFRNSFCAFRIAGTFTKVVATAPPALTKPYPRFDAVAILRKSFPLENIEGSILGYYSPAFAAGDGIPGYHFHFLSDDRRRAGHATSFALKGGRIDAARIDDFTLSLPRSAAYDACVLP